jgi:hypothetical protein
METLSIQLILVAVLLSGCHEHSSSPEQAEQRKGSGMTFTVYIARQNGTITLNDWKAAVQSVSDVRIASTNLEATNPNTGETINLGNPGGDAELHDAASGEWRRVFFWSVSGRISFSADNTFENRQSQIRRTAHSLANSLKAVVEDEYGTTYD